MNAFLPIHLMIPIIVLFLSGIVAIVSILTHHFRQKARYDLVRLSIEKGQPLPPFGLDSTAAPSAFGFRSGDRRIRTPRCDLRSALILLAISAGLYFGFSEIGPEGRRVTGFVFLPGCIGVALLVNALIGIVFPPKPASITGDNLKQ